MTETLSQIITIKNRNRFEANSVIDVEGFDEDYLIVNTKIGKLCIEGKELKMNDLSSGDGKIVVSGYISGVYFKDENEKKRGGKSR